jgi:hypothetical protein
MNFFWFETGYGFDLKELAIELEDSGFSGVLLPYSFVRDDYFVKIANTIDPNKTIKYMVAIRPYTISAQYLSMINNAFDKISSDRIIINLITGFIYDKDKTVGGILGEVNDLSSNIERSNYLISYVKSLKNISSGFPNFYVSVSNQPILDGVYEEKVIVPYSMYKRNELVFDPKKTMVSVCLIIRKTKEELDSIKRIKRNPDTGYFTFEEFETLLNEFKLKGINDVLISEDQPGLSKSDTLSFVSNYTNKETNILGGKNDTSQ